MPKPADWDAAGRKPTRAPLGGRRRLPVMTGAPVAMMPPPPPHLAAPRLPTCSERLLYVLVLAVVVQVGLLATTLWYVNDSNSSLQALVDDARATGALTAMKSVAADVQVVGPELREIMAVATDAARVFQAQDVVHTLGDAALKADELVRHLDRFTQRLAGFAQAVTDEPP